VAFAYVGYPALLAVLARVAPRPVRRGDFSPAVSVIIAVHNGETRLGDKLENVLGQDYPQPIEVIVSSDGSDDGTEAVAAAFAERGVWLVANPVRKGKEAAQAAAIERAAGEVLVFTDLDARLEPGTLRELVRPFADPSVGAVSSEDVVEGEGGEGAYVRYEMALRRLETAAATLVGLSGSLCAVRREIARPWPSDLASDFRIALECSRRGLRAVSEPSARARFGALDAPGAEWSRKVRTIRRGIAVLLAYRDVLHPRFGRAALALWGHKLARFTSPFALVALLLASAAAAPHSAVAATLLAAQAAGYAIGGVGLLVAPLRGFLLPRLAAFFLVVNASTLVAWAYHLSGRRAVTWQPTRR
jgi:cellulose synthase/poly-beta-1,6-N-acetylglucosamine synthase-like glycosyltransferase